MPKDSLPGHAPRSTSLLDAVDREGGSVYAPSAPVADPSGMTAPTGAVNNDLILQSFDTDLLTLVNLTQSTLTRAMRPQIGGRGEGVLGPLQKGIEIAERIEQRGRSLLLETSLTHEQRPRVLCAAQNAGDQSVALRSARYAWQTCAILTAIPGGNGTFARVWGAGNRAGNRKSGGGGGRHALPHRACRATRNTVCVAPRYFRPTPCAATRTCRGDELGDSVRVHDPCRGAACVPGIGVGAIGRSQAARHKPRHLELASAPVMAQRKLV